MTDIRPHPGPQEMYHATSADIAFYGGANGGGKSWSLLVEPLRHLMTVKGFGCVIFRRESPQIRAEGGLWDESQQLYPSLGAKSRETFLDWTFPPHGNKLKFAQMQYEDDRKKWDGSQIALLQFDQLEEFARSQFFHMIGRNRSTCGVRPYIRANYNPVPEDDPIGGWLHAFVGWYLDANGEYPDYSKAGVIRWFVNLEDTLYWYSSQAEALAEHPDSRPLSFTYIPARVYDNPTLLAADPDYLAKLKGLGKVEQERRLEANHKIKPAAGDMFDMAWFEVIAAVPKSKHPIFRVRYWDKAGTQGAGDFTAGVLLACTTRPDPDKPNKLKVDQFFIEDVIMGQWSAANRERVIGQTAEADAGNSRYASAIEGVVIGIEQEPGSGGKESAEATIANLPEHIVYADRPTGSKVTRAEPVAAQARIGNVKMIRGEWNKRILAILHNFPDGIKDPVDGLSGAYSGIIKRVSEYRPQPDFFIL